MSTPVVTVFVRHSEDCHGEFLGHDDHLVTMDEVENWRNARSGGEPAVVSRVGVVLRHLHSYTD